MGVLNSLRMNNFKNNGYKSHEYVGSIEETINLMNGNKTDIGWNFSNGEPIPFTEGERCFSLPVTNSKEQN